MTTRARILHTSDWQIGMKRWFLGERLPLFTEARFLAIERMAEIAKEKQCDAVVVAGDIFDTPTISQRLHHRFLEAIDAFDVPVVMLPGNHDYVHPGSMWKGEMGQQLQARGVTILDDTSIHTVGGIEICGAPLTSNLITKDPVGEVLTNLPPAAPDTIRVFVGHGQCGDGFGDTTGMISLPTVTEAIARRQLDYLALGDTHSTMKLDTAGAVYYSGAPEVTAFDDRERDSGNALIVDICLTDEGDDVTSSVEVESVPVGSWSFHAEHADIDGTEQLEQWLERMENWENKSRTVVKYSLVGSINSQAMVRLEDQVSTFNQAFVSFYERSRLMDLAIVPDAFDLDDWGLHGYARDAAEELLDCDDPASRDALALLYRLTEN